VTSAALPGGKSITTGGPMPIDGIYESIGKTMTGTGVTRLRRSTTPGTAGLSSRLRTGCPGFRGGQMEEGEKKKKALIYARELPIYPGDEVLGVYYEEKWHSFDELLNRSEGDAETIYVMCPEVLGDDYLELLVNLSKIAKAGLALMIADPAKTIKVKEILDLP